MGWRLLRLYRIVLEKACCVKHKSRNTFKTRTLKVTMTTLDAYDNVIALNRRELTANFSRADL